MDREHLDLALDLGVKRLLDCRAFMMTMMRYSVSREGELKEATILQHRLSQTHTCLISLTSRNSVGISQEMPPPNSWRVVTLAIFFSLVSFFPPRLFHTLRNQ